MKLTIVYLDKGSYGAVEIPIKQLLKSSFWQSDSAEILESVNKRKDEFV